MKINRKRRAGQTEDMWIGDLLDRVDEEKLLEISAIHSDVPMPVPNQEKLAQSVIDKADLADEEELERRRAFAKAYRRKKLLHGCAAAGVVAAVFAVLAFMGVFDRISLAKYSYRIEAAVVQNGADVETQSQLNEQRLIETGGFRTGVKEASLTEKEKDKLDNTAYDAVADYCKTNHYAVDEHKVLRYWTYEEAGKEIVMCEIASIFMELDKSPDGKGKKMGTRTSQIVNDFDRPDTLESYLTNDMYAVMPEEGLDETQGVAVFLLALEL